MKPLDLEPFAARLRWRLLEPRSISEWKILAGVFLECVAAHCGEDPACVIGHIKSLATFPEGGYLRSSVVTTRRPADVEAEGELPETCPELVFSLNVLVYGLPSQFIHDFVEACASKVAAGHGGTATVEHYSLPGQRSHRHA